MTVSKAALFALSLTLSVSGMAAPLLFLKGDRLYQVTGGTEIELITSGVTKVVKGTALFLKNDRLYRLTEGANFEYITQQVTEVCDDANYLVKQNSRLYSLNASYETEYITAGVTSCSAK